MKHSNMHFTKCLILTLSFFLTFTLSIFAQDHPVVDNRDPKDKPDEYEILISYTDGSSETLRSEFYSDEVTGKPFIFKNNCERIYADQTKTIVIKNYKNDIEKAMSYDNAWFFEVEGLTGPKLNVYNDRPYKQNVSNYYFQKPDGKLVKYSKATVKDIFSDQPEALKYAKKHLRAKVYQKVVLYSGLAIAVPGSILAISVPAVGELITVFGVKATMLTFLVGGGIVSSCNYAFTNSINSNLYKAVMLYNQQW